MRLEAYWRQRGSQITILIIPPVKKIFPSLLLLAGTLGAHAQSIGPSTLNAAGGSGTIAGTSHSYSIGEMTVVSTAITPQIVVTHGVLQPDESSLAVGDGPSLVSQLSLFPNPAQATLHLQPRFGAGGELSCSLVDATGKLVLTHTAALHTGNERQTLQLGAVAAGTYLLSVRFGAPGAAPQTATYKIQKIQ